MDEGSNMTVVDGRLSSNPINPSAHIVFNNQQQAAIDDIISWVAEGGDEEPYLLQGYAGTGKTTLVREVMDKLTVPLSRIALVAPTNRAAKVLGNKTGLHTMTIHKLIYLTVREELDYQRERLHMWESARNFTDLADLIIESNETDLAQLYVDEGGYNALDEEGMATDATFLAWLDQHRKIVLKYEGVELPDDDAQRLAYFGTVQKAKLREHKDQITELLQEDLKVRKKEPAEIISRYSLIVVDEASMVNEQVGKDLVSFGVPVILVGDPFQLPPVKAKPYWQGRRAQSRLTKIERQKGPGAGIPLAGERIREGKDLERNESLGLHRRGVLENAYYVSADQIICGTHKTRERVCRVVRDILGHKTPYPQVGEKIVAVYNDKAAGIMNGELYYVRKVGETKNPDVIIMDIEDPYGKVIKDVTAWTKGFPGRGSTDYLPDFHGKFWFGYCITCHQSQGSEWKDIIVCDDWPRSDEETHSRWLYTAITRASNRCELIR